MSAVTEFNDRIIQRFPPSFRWDDAQKRSWSEDMVRELGGFSAEVLERAVRQIVATRRDLKTPLVSECIAACLDAKRWIEAEKRKGELPIGASFIPGASHQDWTAERLRLADDLIMGPEGRQAAREGWVVGLWDYARKHSRLPPASEFGTLRREAKEFDEAYAECVKGGWPHAQGMERLGAAMLKRREEKTQMVLHGVVR